MFGKFVAPSDEWDTIEKNKSSKRLWGIRMSNDYNNIDKLAEFLHNHYMTHGRTFVAVAEKVKELMIESNELCIKDYWNNFWQRMNDELKRKLEE